MPIFGGGQSGGGTGGIPIRVLIGGGIALFAMCSYFMSSQENPITGESERVSLSVEQEIQLGLQAVDEMAKQHGGFDPSDSDQRVVDRLGEDLLRTMEQRYISEGGENPYKFEFHLLRDPKTINAFALPGGQVFITRALYDQLQTEAQVAGVLGHEIGHVIERHSAKRMAKQQLFGGLAAATGVASGDANAARMSQMVAAMVNMKYGREQELQSDKWGVRLMTYTGYDPRAMMGVMEVLEAASGGGGPPEFMSTHPKPANRVEYIKQVIESEFPSGLPPALEE